MLDTTILTPYNVGSERFYLWLTYTTETNKVYQIVSNVTRTEYYLFKNNKQTRYKSDNPCELYKYIKE